MSAPAIAPQATILAYIRAAAQDIAASHADLELAGADLRGAKAAFLEKLLDAVRPCARSLGGPVAMAMTVSPAGTTTEPAGWRGLYLDGLGPKIANRTPVEQPGYARAAWPERGRHSGTRLLLRDDGELVELSYDGPWSNVPGEVSSWRATATALEPDEVLARGYKLEPICNAIGEAMDAQANGKAAAKAAELRGKANRLRGWSLLVRGL